MKMNYASRGLWITGYVFMNHVSRSNQWRRFHESFWTMFPRSLMPMFHEDFESRFHEYYWLCFHEVHELCFHKDYCLCFMWIKRFHEYYYAFKKFMNYVSMNVTDDVPWVLRITFPRVSYSVYPWVSWPVYVYALSIISDSVSQRFITLLPTFFSAYVLRRTCSLPLPSNGGHVMTIPLCLPPGISLWSLEFVQPHV